jgi:ankyrin repeat protein
VFEYLLAQGAQTSSGSPLAALVYADGPLELIEKLLAKTKDINAYCNSFSLINDSRTSVTRPPPYHKIQSVSPLQAAALRGREQTIRLLLQNGAAVNCPARNSCGVTPLQAICGLKAEFPQDREKKLRIINLLLDYGAHVNGAPAWNLGLSALQSAAMVGDVQVADLLRSRGADVNAPGANMVKGQHW